MPTLVAHLHLARSSVHVTNPQSKLKRPHLHKKFSAGAREAHKLTLVRFNNKVLLA